MRTGTVVLITQRGIGMLHSRAMRSVSEYARRLGSRGGKARRDSLTPQQRSASARKAAKARAKKMTAEQRRDSARKAVLARWAKRKSKP